MRMMAGRLADLHAGGFLAASCLRRRFGRCNRRSVGRRRDICPAVLGPGIVRPGVIRPGVVRPFPGRSVIAPRMAVRPWRLVRLVGCRFPGGRRRRLLGNHFLRRCIVTRCTACYWCVFVIACQISLTPRPVTAENGSGSAYCLMAFSPRCCSA
jgi:hypothetical protein